MAGPSEVPVDTAALARELRERVRSGSVVGMLAPPDDVDEVTAAVVDGGGVLERLPGSDGGRDRRLDLCIVWVREGADGLVEGRRNVERALSALAARGILLLTAPGATLNGACLLADLAVVSGTAWDLVEAVDVEGGVAVVERGRRERSSEVVDVVNIVVEAGRTACSTTGVPR